MISHKISETKALGRQIASRLKARDNICLTGALGGGKTTLTQAIMQALGVVEPITSPTYTIVNEYHHPMTIFHFDVYRINDPDEMYEIGFDDYLSQEAIIIIEWANLIEEIIPKDSIWIDIKYTGEDEQRIIHVRGLEGLNEDFEY